jgi:hypothetical protein
MKQIINELIVFLKNPVDERAEIQTAKQKIKTLFVFLIIQFLFAGIITGIAAVIEHYGFIDTESHAVYSLLEQLPVWMILLTMAGIIPFIEELVFRLPLRFKYDYFSRLAILLSYIAGKQNKIKFETWLKTFWTNNYRPIFYLYAIIFALIHLTNYKISVAVLIFAPILIVAQFVGGLLFSYLRVRYNFILGFLMHAIYNGILISTTLISMFGSVEKLNIDNEQYYLKIEEVSPREEFENLTFGEDTMSYNVVNLKTIICLLLEQEEYFVETNNDKMLETKINLEFINHSEGKSENEKREIILNHLSDIYNFDIERKTKKQEVFELCIDDTTKLMKYKSNPSDSVGSVTTSEDKIEAKNVGLKIIAYNLTPNYDKVIRYPLDYADDKNNYNLTIPAKLDFQALQDLLHTEYGLSLKKEKEFEIEYIYVNFKE